MRINLTLFTALLLTATFACRANDAALSAAVADQPIPTTATGLLAACVASLPHDPLELRGTMSVRKQRGIVVASYPYRLRLDWGATPQVVQCDLVDDTGAVQERLRVTRQDTQRTVELRAGANLTPVPTPPLTTPVCGTDVTWLDLTLDFLWWGDARIDGQDSVKGHDCAIVRVSPPAPMPDCAGVRLWIEPKIRCLLQAEQLDGRGQPARRMTIRSVKEFNKRWLISELEIARIDGDFRTRLHVDDVLTP